MVAMLKRPEHDPSVDSDGHRPNELVAQTKSCAALQTKPEKTGGA
jgi:hypothetical protein